MALSESQVLRLGRQEPKHLSTGNKALSTLTQIGKKHNRKVLPGLTKELSFRNSAQILRMFIFSRIQIFVLNFLIWATVYF